MGSYATWPMEWSFMADPLEVDAVCPRVIKAITDHSYRLSDSRLFRLELMLREAMNNAVLHGCRGDRSMTVTCSASVVDEVLEFIVDDPGPGFDWRSRIESQGDLHGTSGRGMSIMTEYADSVEFNEAGNRLTLKFSLAEVS